MIPPMPRPSRDDDGETRATWAFLAVVALEAIVVTLILNNVGPS